MSEDVSFINMDTYRGEGNNEGLTFKAIVMQQINRCVINGSVEFYGGYDKEKIVSSGGGSYRDFTHVPSTRDAFTNAVRTLKSLLIARFDDKMNKEYNKLIEEYKAEIENIKLTAEKDQLRAEVNKFQIEWHYKLFEALQLLCSRHNYFMEESVDIEM